MSAIAAVWCFSPGADPGALVERMGAALAVHGPDSARHWDDRQVALAYRGRHVLPEDRHDRQPLTGPGAAVLAADCRIDNRNELRAALGLDAEPRPDSAYILAAYERWGEQCVEHLVGDFAFVVWDPRRQRLFAARDHLGVRPLYFHRGRHCVALASMPKGLFALADVPRRLNQTKLLDILLLLPETGTDTCYEGIERIPPGHTLTVTQNGHQLRRYWQLDTQRRLRLADDDEYLEAFQAAFEEAVRCRLRSGAGLVASQLSGGFDSSSVTTLAAEQLAREGRRLLALTAAPRAGFDGPVPKGRHADESGHAARVAARHANVEHVVVREGRGLLAEIEPFVQVADIPILNPCNQNWIAALARTAHDRGAAVMLTGAMGNMTISHPGHHRLAELVQSARLPTLYRELRALARRPGGSWKRAIALALGPVLPGTLLGLKRLLGRDTWRDVTDYTALDPQRHPPAQVAERARARGWDLRYRTWGDSRAMRAAVLGRMDAAPFHSGMEAVYGVQPLDPTSDKRLAELCLAIPEEQYFRDGEDRRLLRRMMAGRLPEALMAERGKGYQGADWYEYLLEERDGVARELERYAGSSAAGLLDLTALQEELQALAERRPDAEGYTARYRQRLLRGLGLGTFIRSFEGGNR